LRSIFEFFFFFLRDVTSIWHVETSADRD
jgi:hypothetical protein